MGDVRAVHMDPVAFPDPQSFQYDCFTDPTVVGNPILIGPSGLPLFAWGGGTHVVCNILLQCISSTKF
jgi:cytochrome P450